MLGLCWGYAAISESEHECWEKTVTEGMAMQADHKQNNEHECWEKTVTEAMAMQTDHKQNHEHE